MNDSSQGFKNKIDLNDITLSNDPILIIDSVIQFCRQGNFVDKNLEKQLKKIVFHSLAHLSEEKLTDPNRIENHVFDLITNQSFGLNSNLVIICLMRLSSENKMKWLYEEHWCRAIVKFIEDNIPSNIYEATRSNWYPHQQLDDFSQIVNRCEAELDQALKMLTSLDRFRSQRHNLLKVLNGRPGNWLLAAFLPKDILPQLGEIYIRTEKYSEMLNEPDKIIGIYRSVMEAFDVFEKLLVGKPTIYSETIYYNVLLPLKNYIQEDFSKNQAVQPADINIEEYGKKYPLYSIDQTIELGFVIKNFSSGYADNITIRIYSSEIIVNDTETAIKHLSPSESQSLAFPAQVYQESQAVNVTISVNWDNFDGNRLSKSFDFCLYSQSNVDWESVERTLPYSLEAVENIDELVGRRDVFDRLIALVDNRGKVGSAIIQGQKRVGKTSIAKTLKSYLEDQGYLVIYLEAGDYVEPEAEATIARLGKRLSKKILDYGVEINHIKIPEFDKALSPFTDFLDDISALIPEKRIVFILDEFDQLPLNLYQPGPLGNAFFLTMRSIGSKKQVGFVLVGGEKMSYIMSSQGYQLNKWLPISVDYFTRESDWADYVDLVCKPVENVLEFSNDAIEALHNITAGNPYFTKLICATIFHQARIRRDSHITRKEIDESMRIAARESDQNTFQHFWMDGILDSGISTIDKAMRRQKTLIAVSDGLSKYGDCTLEVIQNHPLTRNLTSIESELKEFVTRKILVTTSDQKVYDFKVKFFQKWLISRGVQELLSNFSDEDIIIAERIKEEQLKVKPIEIVDLISQWGSKQYKGQGISEDKVRAWLDQFEGVKAQRAMFSILKNLKYYSDGTIRSALKGIDGTIKRSLPQYIRDSARAKRSDIAVSYLDGPTKSGGRFAKFFADEAFIYQENVIEKGKLIKTLEKSNEIKALVFVDDLVATGDQSSENIEFIDRILAPVVKRKNIKVFFVAALAYIDGWKKIENQLSKLSIQLETHACEILDASNKCFGEESSIFPDEHDREFAKSIALRYGTKLQKDNPLGYGNLQLAIVFEQSCPNDSLPILWSEATDNSWLPLFIR